MSARTVIGNSPNPIHFDCTLPVNTTMWLATATTTAAAAALSESPSVNLMNWDWKTEMVGKYEHQALIKESIVCLRRFFAEFASIFACVVKYKFNFYFQYKSSQKINVKKFK